MSRPTFPISLQAGRAATLVGLLRRGVTAAEVSEALWTYGEDRSVVVAESALASLRAVADELYPIFAAETVDAAAAAINDVLARWSGPPRLSDHDGTAWHLHLDQDDDGPWDAWLATSAAFALAALVADTGRPPGGICSARECDRPYVNSGAGAPQRFCSPQCATRARVQAHRRRSG
ncbi:MAG TPA: CGNR zinc finger domain-containing protein [Mycobacteriales bacterium]|nr:CGNR zinc finger domain-containing protein [Mycobacteriales bacterium]